MSKTIRLKTLRAANAWRKKHMHWRIGGVAVTGNPPLHKPPASTPATKTHQVVAYAHTSLTYAGRMNYTMTTLRSQLFHRKPGDFLGAHADCSQYVSAILHWVGVTKVNDKDATGSLLLKGKKLSTPKAGCVVVFGAAPGEHAAFITEKEAHGVWWTIGFGHQSAPDRVSLPNMKKYFQDAGHPGVTYLDFID